TFLGGLLRASLAGFCELPGARTRGEGFCGFFAASLSAASWLACSGVAACAGCAGSVAAGAAAWVASGVGVGVGEGCAVAVGGACCGFTRTGFFCVQPVRIASAGQSATIVAIRRSDFMLCLLNLPGRRRIALRWELQRGETASKTWFHAP